MHLSRWLQKLGFKSVNSAPEHLSKSEEAPAYNSTKYILISIVWFFAVAALTTAMIEYSGIAGARDHPPAHWPPNNKIKLYDSKSTLVMFVHPHCPCTHASLDELEKLMAKCNGLVSGYVVLVKPIGTDSDWTNTDINRIASNIFNIKVVTDSGSALTRQFGCNTSGSTLLYNQLGALLFEGGITQARGHSGDNAGRSAIQNILHGRVPEVTATPVFGCELFDSLCTMGDVN